MSRNESQSRSRRLAPAGTVPEQLPRQLTTPEWTTVSKRPRAGNRKACVRCRAKKRRCDETRPKCFRCAEEGAECFYRSDPAEEHRKAVELLHRFRHGSEKDAIDLLLRFRSSLDPMAVLSSDDAYAACLNQYRPSTVAAARAPFSPAMSTVELELSVLHPSVYPPPDPRAHGPAVPDDHTTLQQHILPLNPEPEHHAALMDLPEGPQPSHSLCDRRLAGIEVDHWSGVPIPNDLAARAFSCYFELTHPILGLFEADLFINDLVCLNLHNCSSFLVSAVLAYACQSYTGVEIETASYARAFFEEADSFWRAERSTDSVINVAAILMLSVSSHTYVGHLHTLELLLDGRTMAERLELFNVREMSQQFAARYPPNTQLSRAAAHVAHGAYAWLTLNTFYCQVKPIDYPPLFSIPTHEGSPTFSFMGHTFTTLCSFWSLMQDIAAVYFAHRKTNKPVRHPIPIAFAETQYQKLLAWADNLPPDMTLQESRPDHVFIFHVLFHCAILDIFEPFTYDRRRGNRLGTFASADASINSVLRASTDQLERLILECRHYRPRALLVTHVNSAMLHVANAILRDSPGSGLHEPDRRLNFLIALANCGDMYTCFPVFGSIGRGLLSMAMRDGLLSSKDARELIATLENKGVHHDVSVRRPAGAFAIDFELATREYESAQAYNMALQFDELVLFSDVVSGQ